MKEKSVSSFMRLHFHLFFLPGRQRAWNRFHNGPHSPEPWRSQSSKCCWNSAPVWAFQSRMQRADQGDQTNLQTHARGREPTVWWVRKHVRLSTACGWMVTFCICCSDQKLRRIQFLKKELELKLDEVNLEIDDLVVLQSRVTKALDACKEPLEVTDLCMKER